MITSITQRLLGVFFIVIIYLISPIILIRVGRLRDSTLGTLSQEIDYWFFLKSKIRIRRKCINIWYLWGPISANNELVEIIKSQEFFLPRFIVKPVFLIANKYRIFHQHLIPYYVYRTEEIRPGYLDLNYFDWDEIHSTPGLRSLITDYNERCNYALELLGVNGRNMIGIHIRDNFYHSNRARILAKNGYLDNFDKLTKVEQLQEYRNSKFTNFIPSISQLSNLGYFTIRFGSNNSTKSEHELKNFVNLSLRSEKTNIELVLICQLRFLICSTSGLTSLARFARVPQFLIDFGDITGGYIKSSTLKSTPIILPKVFKYKATNQNLKFSEIIKLQIFKLTSLEFRQYYNSIACPFYLADNEETVVTRTVLMGKDILEHKISSTSFRLHQNNFLQMYPYGNIKTSPILSPYWPNLN